MTPRIIEDFLLWCVVLNYAILLVWVGTAVFARGWAYRISNRLFALPIESFNTIQYAGIAAYKLGIMLFNLVPLIAIHVAS